MSCRKANFALKFARNMNVKKVSRIIDNKLPNEPSNDGIDPRKTFYLHTNSIWMLIGNCAYGVSQWGILILVSKYGTVEMVGKFSLALAITAPVILFSNLGLRSVQATDASEVYKFGHYLSLRLVTTGVAFLTIAGIVTVMRYPRDTSLVILSVGLAKSFESISDVIYGLLQQHERMDKISLSMIMKGLLSFLGVAAGLFLGNNLFWGVIGLVAAWGLTLVTYDLPVGKKIMVEFEGVSPTVDGHNNRFQPLWNWDQIFRLVRLTLPLGITAILISLNLNIPRYFLESSFGENSLGIFAALAYPVTAERFVINAIGQSASPQLAKYFEYGNVRKFTNLLLTLSSIGFLIGLAGIILVLFFGQYLLGMIYQAEYANYGQEFLWMALVAGVELTFSFMGYGMTAAHYFRIQPVIYFISVALSIGLGYVWIPVYGILGAVQVLLITTCFQSAAMMGVNIYALRKRRLKLDILNDGL